ncbi:MAG: class I SAM-dependent methyltransferase [Planctomycetota bacterium]
MPTPAAFWDKVADKYDANTVKGPNYAARLDRAAQWFGPDARLLDLGCAGGHITLDLAPRVGRVHGVDISPKLIDIARKRAQDLGVTNAEFTCGAVDELAFEPASFDGVTAYSLLHLVPDVPETLRWIFAVLRPGGRLVIEAPCREELHALWRAVIAVMRAVGKAPAVKAYPQAEYEAMLRDAGFEVEEVRIDNPKSMARRFLARKPGSDAPA